MTVTISLIVLLILAGLVLILFELLTPTFGPLAAMALTAFVAAVWLAATISSSAGIAVGIALAVAVPAYVVLLVRTLPKSRFSRKMFLEKIPDLAASGTPDAAQNLLLVGKIGTAETMLRPLGVIRIEGRRVHAMAEGKLIEAGGTVKVVAADGTNVIVRLVPPAAAANPTPSEPPPPAGAAQPDQRGS